MLAEHNGKDVDLEVALRAQILLSLENNAATRISFFGPKVSLKPKVAETILNCFHELTTN